MTTTKETAMGKVWFITGAGRGLGAAIARAVLAAGERVVATGRDPARVAAALGGPHERLLVAALDLADPVAADAVVANAIDRFGRVDVLVNNAGYGQFGMFEETTSDEVADQFRVNVFGTMAVTRALLPTLRRQRSGHVVTVTSIGGLRGAAGASLYCATKFALEGWSEALVDELSPFGIRVTAVEPGFFRTDFLDASSIRHATPTIDDYATASRERRAAYDARSHRQPGDPDRLAAALLALVASDAPPIRFLAGSDAVGVLEARIERDRAWLASGRAQSSATDRAD